MGCPTQQLSSRNNRSQPDKANTRTKQSNGYDECNENDGTEYENDFRSKYEYSKENIPIENSVGGSHRSNNIPKNKVLV